MRTERALGQQLPEWWWWGWQAAEVLTWGNCRTTQSPNACPTRSVPSHRLCHRVGLTQTGVVLRIGNVTCSLAFGKWEVRGHLRM